LFQTIQPIIFRAKLELNPEYFADKNFVMVPSYGEEATRRMLGQEASHELLFIYTKLKQLTNN